MRKASKEYTQEEKHSVIEEAQIAGLSIVLPKYGISYATFEDWRKSIQVIATSRKKASDITRARASTILTPGSGFMDEFDYTMNPYSGCAFGCTYCYAAFFSRSETDRVEWGNWVRAKENALELLIKYRKKSLDGKSIYISSVTDPYQPVERELMLTRSLLAELAAYHKPRVVIQTRSPLISRDVDIIKTIPRLQVNMTVTTDSEKVRRVFEPYCPSNALRLKTVRDLVSQGIGVCITLTPLLPIENPNEFAAQLMDTGATKFIIQPFHGEKGKFVAGTRDKAVHLIREMNWTMERYNKVFEVLVGKLPNLGVGKNGFAPI